MKPETIALIAGAILSLLFSYVPLFRTWFDQQDPTRKRLVMLALLLVSAAGIFVLQCAGWLAQLWPGLAVTCSQEGALQLIQILILAIIANQGVYAISPQVSKKPIPTPES